MNNYPIVRTVSIRETCKDYIRMDLVTHVRELYVRGSRNYSVKVFFSSNDDCIEYYEKAAEEFVDQYLAWVNRG